MGCVISPLINSFSPASSGLLFVHIGNGPCRGPFLRFVISQISQPSHARAHRRQRSILLASASIGIPVRDVHLPHHFDPQHQLGFHSKSKAGESSFETQGMESDKTRAGSVRRAIDTPQTFQSHGSHPWLGRRRRRLIGENSCSIDLIYCYYRHRAAQSRGWESSRCVPGSRRRGGLFVVSTTLHPRHHVAEFQGVGQVLAFILCRRFQDPSSECAGARINPQPFCRSSDGARRWACRAGPLVGQYHLVLPVRLQLSHRRRP